MSKKKICGIAGIVLGVVIIILGIVFFGTIKNSIMRLVMSDEVYMQKVLEDNLEESLEVGANYYKASLVDQLKDLNKSQFEGNLLIKLDKFGKELLDETAKDYDIDTSWFDSMNIKYKEVLNKDTIDASMLCALNDVDIATLNMQYMQADGKIYLQIPELSEKFVGFPQMEEPSNANYNAQAESLYDLCEKIPDEILAKKLADKYLKILISNIDDVTAEKKQIVAGGITKKEHYYTTSISDATMCKAIMDCTQEAMSDEDLKKLVMDCGEDLIKYSKESEMDGFLSDCENGEEVYAVFVEALETIYEDAQSELEDSDLADEGNLNFSIYVDAKGNIEGIVFKTEAETIKVLYPSHKNKSGLTISYQDEVDSCAFAGSGTTKKDKLTGKYYVKVNDSKLMKIKVTDYDLAALRKGTVSGKFEFGFTDEIGEVADLNKTESEILSKLVIKYNVLSNASKQKFNLSAVFDGKKVGTLKATATKKKAGDGLFAENDIADAINLDSFYDLESLSNYLTSVSASTIPANMEKAGVPYEYTSLLETAIINLQTDNLYGNYYQSLEDDYGYGYYDEDTDFSDSYGDDFNLDDYTF